MCLPLGDADRIRGGVLGVAPLKEQAIMAGEVMIMEGAWGQLAKTSLSS